MVVRVAERHAAAGAEAACLKRSLGRMAAKLAAGRDLEISLALVGDAEIEALNRVYMGKPEPTDVISFPQMDRDEIEATGRSRAWRALCPRRRRSVPLGDIVINLDAASRQAAERGHSFSRELEVLGAHGLLHLFGYSHDDEGVAREMAAAENELVGRSIIFENARET